MVMKRFETTTPEGVDLVLWNLKSWDLYENCDVYTLILDDGTEIHMLAERKYPFSKETLERMLSLRLVAGTASEDAYTLLIFIQKHQELASPEQTASGKDFLNPLIADSLLKTIWFSNHHASQINDVEANLEQFKSETLAWQKETSNRFDRMQESIDKNKEDADRQFAELVNNVTTAGPKAVVSVVVGYGENVVKSLACWIWRPTVNVIDYTSKDSGSYMFKRFDYVDLQGRL
ncbi:hypothetical protein Tco_1454685, partial [Tanacetum coccineum]